MSKIELKEVKLTPVDSAQCYAHCGQVVLMLNGKAYVLSADAAVELAFQMASAVDGSGP